MKYSKIEEKRFFHSCLVLLKQDIQISKFLSYSIYILYKIPVKSFGFYIYEVLIKKQKKRWILLNNQFLYRLALKKNLMHVTAVHMWPKYSFSRVL